jgi:hypothetical protein
MRTIIVATNHPTTPRGVLTQNTLLNGDPQFLQLLTTRFGLPSTPLEGFDYVYETHHCDVDPQEFVDNLPGEVQFITCLN